MAQPGQRSALAPIVHLAFVEAAKRQAGVGLAQGPKILPPLWPRAVTRRHVDVPGLPGIDKEAGVLPT